MLNKTFGGMAGLGAASCATAIIAALQTIATGRPTDTTWLWAGALAFFVLFVIGAAGWLLTGESSPPEGSSVEAKAERAGIAQTAGRDVVTLDSNVLSNFNAESIHIGDVHSASAKDGDAPTAELRLTAQIGRSQRSRPVIREAATLTVRGRRVGQGYGRIVRAFHANEMAITARLNEEGLVEKLDEHTAVPIYTPIWTGHDIYLRWAGREETERYATFSTEAVMELAIDTFMNGASVAFVAAASNHAEETYQLHPGHEYLLEIEVGAENASPVVVYYHVLVFQSHLDAGILSKQRLDVEDVSVEYFNEHAKRGF